MMHHHMSENGYENRELSGIKLKTGENGRNPRKPAPVPDLSITKSTWSDQEENSGPQSGVGRTFLSLGHEASYFKVI